MVRILHDKAAGRTRYSVPGLFRSDALKGFLERRLKTHPAITDVYASTLTGNILVKYHTEQNPISISLFIQSVLNGKPAAEKTQAPPHRSPGRKPSSSTKAPRTAALGKRMVLKAIEKLSTHVEAQPIWTWHTLERKRLIGGMGTDIEKGLTLVEVDQRQKRFGLNKLKEIKQRSGWDILLEQFNSLPTYLLAAAAGVSLITGGIVDAIVILGVVVANAAIGYSTEKAAEQTIYALHSLVQPSTFVLREGKTVEIPIAEVTPGDVLILKPGTYVGADCRIIKAENLTINESMLTGESLPVKKHSRRLQRKTIPLADRVNMAFMGTQVTGGQGKAVVVATNDFTEIGKLRLVLQQTERMETPIERQLRIIGDQLVLMCGAICGFVFTIGFIRGYGLLEMLRTSISLAAAAVPEGLPAAATINFALGIRNLRRDQVLIRRLQAVETLGAIQTICMDKTGTITQNRMTVQKIFSGDQHFIYDGERLMLEGDIVSAADIPEIDFLIRVCVLCSEVKVENHIDERDFKLSGSSTENALVHLALGVGIDVKALRKSHPLVALNHRSEQRHYMLTRHRFNGDQILVALKGSPQEVLAMCRWQLVQGERVPLNAMARRKIEIQNARMAGKALRVLGLAYSVGESPEHVDLENGLTWLGLVGMADPVRRGVKALMASFQKAGIETVMITGDQSQTAYAVARELNISGRETLEILDSSDLSGINDETLASLARKAHVYSRVSPTDKLKIVRALQTTGKTVAMTGDGVNDGPALKAADLGITMGRSGTDLAREVADVVLEDDNLEILLKAVADGRGTYNNIRKSVHFFLSTNLSEIMVMSAAIAAGIGFPLNVMQLLWINIISDIFPGLALSLEDPDPAVMAAPPREARQPLFSKYDYQRMVFESAAISAGSLGAYITGILRYGPGSRTMSLAFQSLTIGQLLHAYSCRSETLPLHQYGHLPRNRYLNLAIAGSLGLQIMTMFVPPLRSLLGLTRLGLADMMLIGGFATLPLLINEVSKKRKVAHV